MEKSDEVGMMKVLSLFEVEVAMAYPDKYCHRSEAEHLYEPCDGKCDGCPYCFADEQTAEEQVVKHELF